MKQSAIDVKKNKRVKRGLWVADMDLPALVKIKYISGGKIENSYNHKKSS